MWDKLKEQFNLLKLEKKKLCLITNSDRFISKDDFLDATASALQGGVDVVILNETNIPDGVIVDIGRKLRILCDEYGATYLVNSRIDIAMITEADGVHLEQNGIRITDAKEILPANAIVGKSVHTPEEIKAAVSANYDYLLLEPLIAQNETSVNPALIAAVKEKITIPTFIGGDITPASLDEITYLEVKKIAVSDVLMYAKSPEYAAREFLKKLS